MRSRHTNKGRTTPINRRGGQTLIEFALTLPLLALVLFGIIQYALIFAASITIRNASVMGAREAVIGTNNAAAVAKAAVAPLLSPSLASATLQTTNVAGAYAYSLTVTYPLPLIIPFVVPGGASSRTLTATTVMR